MKSVTRYILVLPLVVVLLFCALFIQGQNANFPSAQITEFVAPWVCQQGRAASGTSAVDLSEFTIPATLTFSKISVNVNTGDAGNNYSWGIYNKAGTLVAHNTAATVGAGTGGLERTNTEGSVTISPGNYFFGLSADNTTALFNAGGSTAVAALFSTATTSSGGQVPATITLAATAAGTTSQRAQYCFALR